jgi:CheY-like chemotaxis protein
MLVEDDESVRQLTRTILEQRGYCVLVAESGAVALDLARDRVRPIHLLLTDVVMPGMSGHELLRRIRQERPDVRFITGYIDEALARLAGPGFPAFVQKPFLPADLMRRVREVLDADSVGAAPGSGARSEIS